MAAQTPPAFSDLRATRTLVTGGAGFIGSHLATALRTLGSEVTVLDDLSGGGDPAGLPAGVRFVGGSILDASLVAEVMAGCRFVFHQAALGSVPRSVEQPRLYHDVNVTGTLNVLEAARAAGVTRVMFAASSSCYGDNPTLPKTESMPTSPRSPYAANKVCDEAMMSAYAHSYGVDTACLRYFNIFGPRQSPDNAYAAVIAAFAKALVNGRRPVIFGDGEQSRDFTYVDNVVSANLLAASAPADRCAGNVYNVACGEARPLTDVYWALAKELDFHEAPVHLPPRAGDVRDSLADISRAQQDLGYTPLVGFEEGLARTAAWYRSQR
jgi:nucleoside-diphosphate-sugar epimerase